ncbi:MAG: UDP-N-acetylmuramoyl-L-alanyl-D-glutamate--2,6-diaminopimelate ligase, partial [Thermoleophilia bacterium]|nr:UDP-N-acetylmuramoyl-L-alanyl-D-glutamate--2,6-diaminopimelate ligase [Thermoleophilia bacterium]
LVGPGTLFMAREGWWVDSHDFLQDAIDAGASALVVTRPEAVPDGCPVPVWRSYHEDRDLGLMADRFFDAPTEKLRVIGVTGTNGKTSVTWTIAHMLRELGERPALMGTVTYQFEHRTIVARNTTPDGLTIHRFAREVLDAGATALVMEVSSHGIELERIAGVAFDDVAFTNLTRDHLDFHKTFEAYRGAKRRLFTSVLAASSARGATCHAVSMVDDEEGRQMLDASYEGATKVPVSVHGGAVEHGVSVDIVERHGVDATTIVCAGRHVRLPVFGDHNVANTALAAAVVACDDRFDVHAALESMRSFPGVPGRAERVAATREDEPVVLVDYAHSDDAVERIGAAVAATGLAPIIVLGCGGDRDATKRRPMADAALAHAAHCVFTSDNPRSEAPEAIVDAMTDGLSDEQLARVDVVVDRSAAIERAIALSEGRPVLLLGKGHETYQELGGRRFHLDDREEARRALVARRLGRTSADVPLLAGWSEERLATAMKGRVVRDTRRCFHGLSTDTRALFDGAVFVALRGERFDGHAFLADAVRAGAVALVVDAAATIDGLDATVIVVDDTTAALGHMASALLVEARRRHGGLRTVGITGSNGKTTTKELLGALVRSQGGDTLVTPGNLNNHIGLPLTVAAITASTRDAILEMGANRPDDIRELADMARPDVSVITSIGRAHIEGLGGMDGVRQTKGGILAFGARVAVLPLHEATSAPIAAQLASGTVVVTFGGPGATLEVARHEDDGDVVLTGQGLLDGWRAVVPLSLPGEHNALNLAAAVLASVARSGDVSVERMPDAAMLAEALAGVELPGGRLRRLHIAGRTVIDDAYNANPESMRAALEELAATAGTRRVAVLGRMAELGETSPQLHGQAGAAAGTLEAIDELVVVGDGIEALALLEGWSSARGAGARSYEDVDVAIAAIGEWFRSGDTVLVKASNSSGLGRLAARLVERFGSDDGPAGGDEA